MALFETYNYNNFNIVDPNDAEDFDHIQEAKRVLTPARFQKCIDIIDEAIELSVNIANQNNRLVFTKTAILVGDNAIVGRALADYVWESAELAFPLKSKRQVDIDGVDKRRKMFLGGLTRWRTALRSEPWVSYKEDSKRYDPMNGKLIRISNYFVSTTILKLMKSQKMPPKRKGNTLGDLAAKWGAR